MATAREMANLIFLYDDAVLDSGTTIGAGHSTEVAGYVAENLLDADRQTAFKTSDSGTIDFYYDLQSAKAIKAVSIHNHNAYTLGTLNFTPYRSANGADWTSIAAYGVSSYVFDSDFFAVFGATQTYQYFKFEFSSVDAANFFIGRACLWREVYDIPNGADELVRGYLHDEEVMRTKGGAEHRNSRGPLRKVMEGSLKFSATAKRDAILALVEQVELNHKTFVTSAPFGTTGYTAGSRYGMAIHSKFDMDEWAYQMALSSRTHIPLRIVEVP